VAGPCTKWAKPKTRATRPVSSASAPRGARLRRRLASPRTTRARGRARRRPDAEEARAEERGEGTTASTGSIARSEPPSSHAACLRSCSWSAANVLRIGTMTTARPASAATTMRPVRDDCAASPSRLASHPSSSSDASRWASSGGTRAARGEGLIQAGAHRAVTERRADAEVEHGGEPNVARPSARRAASGRARRARAEDVTGEAEGVLTAEQRQREEPVAGGRVAWAAVLAPAEQLGQRSVRSERDQASRLASQPSGSVAQARARR